MERQLPPHLLEPRRAGGGVVDSVLNAAVPEIALDRPGVCTLNGEGNAAGMAQQIRIPPPRASPSLGSCAASGELTSDAGACPAHSKRVPALER